MAEKYFMYNLHTIVAGYKEYVSKNLPEGLELNSSERECLLVLSSTPMATPTQIADICNVSRALITRAINSLNTKSLLETQVNKEDRRSMLISLRPSGEKLAAELRQLRRSYLEKLFEGSSKEERAQMELMIKNLSKRVKKIVP